jgi:2-polyprenyl-6-hydroxyphenyl methylase/3-demethylubiquinone-9 3-methyltransferase
MLGSRLRGIVKRWGPSSLKQAVWDVEFRRGHHLHDLARHGRSAICDTVERYANGGDVLDLGCSDGHIGFRLDPGKYRGYTGVDISEIAIKEARAHSAALPGAYAARPEFHVADIAKYEPSRPYDVILFKDSLYYIPKTPLLKILMRLRPSLKPAGVFIVEMDNIARHSWIRDLVRRNFTMVEDREFAGKSARKDVMRFVFK